MSDNIYDKSNYNAIIPANVRYDKRLRVLDKLLYAEITAICSQNNCCIENNSYFSNLYDIEKETVSRAFSRLKKFNYISIEIQKKTNKRIIKVLTL